MSTSTPSDTPTPEVDAANSSSSTLKADFLASIVVFLVALPLCIGIAVAVGINPARALITGIIGGLVVGWFAGSPLQVSGPAAGLFAIVADLLTKGKAIYPDHKDAAETELEFSLMVLGSSVFLAGVIQLAAGKLRLGQWFRAVSPAVVKGMLAGIGVLILFSQFHVMLDHSARWHGEKAHKGYEYMATIPQAIGKCFSFGDDAEAGPAAEHGDEAGTKAKAETTKEGGEKVKTKNPENHHLAALIGIISLICFVFWPKIAPEKISFLPAALIGITIATIFAQAIALDVVYLKVPESFLSEVTLPNKAWVGLLLNKTVLVGAMVIALIASAETLLCATAVDQLHEGPRTKYDQELSAQGVGNILCGLVGALPMTGVIVRSSANVEAGAKTRMSTIIHGAWLLLFVWGIPGVLEYMPKAALGALLVLIGYKLVNFKAIKKLWKTSQGEAYIFFATVVTIVCTDLLIGVLVGIALSAIKVTVCSKLFVWPSNLRVSLEGSDNDQPARLALDGAATFMCLPKLAAELGRVPVGAELNIDIEKLTYIDHACLELLNGWHSQHTKFGGKVVADWAALAARFVPPNPAESSPTA